MTPENNQEWEDAYHRCLDEEAMRKAYEKQDENDICGGCGARILAGEGVCPACI